MMKDEGRMMKDDDFKLFRGFADGLTDEQTFVIVELLSRLKRVTYGVSFEVMNKNGAF